MLSVMFTCDILWLFQFLGTTMICDINTTISFHCWRLCLIYCISFLSASFSTKLQPQFLFLQYEVSSNTVPSSTCSTSTYFIKLLEIIYSKANLSVRFPYYNRTLLIKYKTWAQFFLKFLLMIWYFRKNVFFN